DTPAPITQTCFGLTMIFPPCCRQHASIALPKREASFANFPQRRPSAVDLTFASAFAGRVLVANVKSKTALESYSCQCPFGPDIRKRVRCKMIRISGPGH